MSKLSNVWVLSDTPASLAEAIAGGLSLGEQVSVLVFGEQTQADAAFSYGASKVYSLGVQEESNIIENYAATIAREISKGSSPTLLLMPGSKRCKALAAKLGIALSAGVVNDALSVEVEDRAIKARHMVYGGLAFGEEKILSSVAIVTVASGTFTAAAATEGRQGETINVSFVEPKNKIKCLELKPKEGSQVDLNKASRVIGVGRGLGKEEDLQMAEELCAVLGAELGCTRPIAEGEKWMGRDRYIGVSGVMLKPDVYLALGVSGQIQHMVGVNTAQTIIAVNKDKNAPIFKVCDYGIVGDLYKVVPALIKAFKG